MGYCIPIVRKKYFSVISACLLSTFVWWAPVTLGNADSSEPAAPKMIEYLERSVPKGAIEQFLAGSDPDDISVSPDETLAMVMERFRKGATFEVPWWTVDGGGGLESTGGDYLLSATIGQPDAAATMAGGDFAMTPGFWAFNTMVTPPESCGIFCDGFESGDTSAWSSQDP